MGGAFEEGGARDWCLYQENEAVMGTSHPGPRRRTPARRIWVLPLHYTKISLEGGPMQLGGCISAEGPLLQEKRCTAGMDNRKDAAALAE